MHASRRLLARVRWHERVLQPGSPTGLTGLHAHPSPRSTLIYLYSHTLQKLKQIPETSVYRQATEALTNKRLAIIESVKPPGFAAWNERMQWQLADIEEKSGQTPPLEMGDRKFILAQLWKKEVDERTVEWDGEIVDRPTLEGPRTEQEKMEEMQRVQTLGERAETKRPSLEPEPLFTEDQIRDLEHDLGGGLLEEVIQVAEGELKLVDIMVEHKVWEDLEEKAPEGQWTYFERTSDAGSS